MAQDMVQIALNIFLGHLSIWSLDKNLQWIQKQCPLIQEVFHWELHSIQRYGFLQEVEKHSLQNSKILFDTRCTRAEASPADAEWPSDGSNFSQQYFLLTVERSYFQILTCCLILEYSEVKANIDLNRFEWRKQQVRLRSERIFSSSIMSNFSLDFSVYPHNVHNHTASQQRCVSSKSRCKLNFSEFG